MLARRINDLNLPGYAGSWFDPATQSLDVATSRAEDFSAIARVGATPVQVAHSLTELEAARSSVHTALESAVGSGKIRVSYVDVVANTVVIHVAESAMSQASAVAATLNPGVPVHLKSAPAPDSGFSSNLLGSDRTRNGTWPLGADGKRSPCSVGASAEKVSGSTYTAGFVTAGHCGTVGNSIVADDSTTSVATVIQSTYNFNSNTETFHEDGGWDATVSPWVPQPQVTGYTDGTISVSGTWAGMLVAPVGTTVCRYGSTSGGPHCGTVSSINASYSPSFSITINGLIKVHGTCTEDGDSGGSLMMASGQVQGTDTGSDNTHSCSGDHSTFDVFFQPIATTLLRAPGGTGNPPVAMLTSHGRSSPSAAPFNCPDSANSGGHVYQCDIPSFDSQGITTLSWTTNTGASSTSTEVSGTCLTGQTVNVTLVLSNPYGNTTKNGSFLCPIGPPP